MGKGNTPIFEGIDALSKDGFRDHYNFQLKKLWHPKIEVPELALADNILAMKKHFGR